MNGLPVAAAVGEVLSLFKQRFHQRTANAGVAVSVDSVGETRTRNADLSGVAALDHAVVSVAPFLHCQHRFLVSPPVLLLVSRRRQQEVWRADWRTFVGNDVQKSSCGGWFELSDPMPSKQTVVPSTDGCANHH